MNLQPTGWRKPNRSGKVSNCVEVGRVSGGAAVRDTKNRDLGYFTATTEQWQAFVSSIKADRFA